MSKTVLLIDGKIVSILTYCAHNLRDALNSDLFFLNLDLDLDLV